MSEELTLIPPNADSLPSLLQRAGDRLIAARSSAEVLEAKKWAELALHLAKVTHAANETHGDCVRIITLAEMIMADKVDRGQASGELANRDDNLRQNTDVRGLDIGAPATLDELGVSRQRLNEWRTIRDAGEEVVERTIGKALAEGRAPTKGEILEAAKQIRAERELERRDERIEKIADISRGNADLPNSQRFPVIYADPPWRYEAPAMGGTNRSVENHYPTMSLDEICALRVSELASDDAILYLWATAPKLAECMKVIEAWGFDYRTCFVWVKDKIGMGYHARNQHELLLIARRGSLPPPAVADRVSSVVYGVRTEHSVKPEEFYALIESFYPTLPKIELFARAPRVGWEAWGNQSEQRE